MISDYQSFTADLQLSKEDICRELYRQNTDMIRIKKEATAIRSLARIIDSTLRLANTKGFHAMTLRDLCADSELSMGGLYAYIRNKDDLIHLIQNHGFILTRRTLLHYTGAVSAPRVKLYEAIKAHLFLSELMRAWFYFSYMEAKSLPEEEKQRAIAMEREIEDIFCDILEAGIDSGDYASDNPRLLSSLIKALLQDWYLKRRKYRDQQVGIEAYAKTILDLVENQLVS